MKPCSHCNNTGSLSKELAGYLDCTNCGTADKRVELNESLRLSGMKGTEIEVAAYCGYQVGYQDNNDRLAAAHMLLRELMRQHSATFGPAKIQRINDMLAEHG